MQRLLDEGKIKAVGTSEASAADMKKINAIVPISAVELECSLFARDSFVSTPSLFTPVTACVALI